MTCPNERKSRGSRPCTSNAWPQQSRAFPPQIGRAALEQVRAGQRRQREAVSQFRQEPVCGERRQQDLYRPIWYSQSVRGRGCRERLGLEQFEYFEFMGR